MRRRARLSALLGALLALPVAAQPSPDKRNPVEPTAAPGCAAQHPDSGAPCDRVQRADAGPLSRMRDGTDDQIAVSDFCPVADGSIDDTPCIQAAVTALCARPSGAGTLYLPAGFYNISAAVGISITCPGVTIKGAGWGNPNTTDRATLINITGSGSAPIFNFGSVVDAKRRYIYGCAVKDLIINAANAPDTPTQTGPAIRFGSCYGGIVDNVFGNRVYQLLYNYAGYHNEIMHSIVDQPPKNGEAIRWDGNDTACALRAPCISRGDLFFVDTVQVNDGFGTDATKNNAVCLGLHGYVASASISHLICNNPHIGLNIDCPAAKALADCPSFINLVDFQTEPDGTSGDPDSFGILASDYEYLSCIDCYVHGNDVRYAAKFYATHYANAGPTMLSGGRYDTAREMCIVTNQYGFQMTGGTIYNCNRGGAASKAEAFYGLAIENNIAGTVAGSGSGFVQGVNFCNYQQLTSAAMGGLWSGSLVDWMVVMGNSFRGCATDTMITNGNTARFINLNNNAH